MSSPFAHVGTSPLVDRLASQRDRIELAFTTDGSVRLPLLSTRLTANSYSWLQAGVGLPEEDLHLREQNTPARAPTPAERRDLLLGLAPCSKPGPPHTSSRTFSACVKWFTDSADVRR
jgi:hypothetical protein